MILFVCLCGWIVSGLLFIPTVTSSLAIVTPPYHQTGCPGSFTAEEKKERCEKVPTDHCPPELLVLDKCGHCKYCPRMQGETCGGPYYIYGDCVKKTGATKHLISKRLECITSFANGKILDAQEVMNGLNVTGVCMARSCINDCSTKDTTKSNWICGSDGQWYRNRCYFNQRNCFLSKENQITKSNECGPKTTFATPVLPKISTTSSSPPPSIENTVLTELEQTPVVSPTPRGR